MGVEKLSGKVGRLNFGLSDNTDHRMRHLNGMIGQNQAVIDASSIADILLHLVMSG